MALGSSPVKRALTGGNSVRWVTQQTSCSIDKLVRGDFYPELRRTSIVPNRPISEPPRTTPPLGLIAPKVGYWRTFSTHYRFECTLNDAMALPTSSLAQSSMWTVFLGLIIISFMMVIRRALYIRCYMKKLQKQGLASELIPPDGTVGLTRG